jgi:hypothetical protein
MRCKIRKKETSRIYIFNLLKLFMHLRIFITVVFLSNKCSCLRLINTSFG